MSRIQNCNNKVYRLNNDVVIPCIGFGTWQTPNGEVAYNAVTYALEAGYTHIDTAQRYENEESVGKALKDYLTKTGASREKFFITSKLSNVAHGYSETYSAFWETLKKLQLEYLDLFLVHWPNPIKYRTNWEEALLASWKAMEKLYAQGYIKAIGVSNFRERHLKVLESEAEIMPMVNQIKLCPSVPQLDIVDLCQKKKILLEGYSPLGTGELLSNAELVAISAKYNKSVAQICIRWSLQKGFLPLPKSVHKDRIESNLCVFDFEIEKEDIRKIDLIKNAGVKPPHNPDEIDF